VDKFWEVLKSSVIIQAAMALTLLGVISYMYIVGMDVPEMLTGFFGIILGYYFGTKSQQQIDKR